MTVRALTAACAAALVCSVFNAGCDQVGAPLVDTRRGGDVLITIVCPDVPPCEPPDAGPPLPRYEARAVDVRTCGGIGLIDTDLCDPPVRADAGPAGAEPGAEPPAERDDGIDIDAGAPDTDDDGAEDDSDFGDVSAQPDPPPLLPPCESAPQARMPAQLDCQDVTSRDAPAPAGEEERLADVHWHDANVRIESSTPRTIVIEQLTATHVWIELRGPVTLRIGGPGATPWISGADGKAHFYAKDGAPNEDLRIAGVATAAGAPQLVLEGVRARSLVVGDETSAFPGRVTVRTGDFFSAQLFARDLTLESTRVEEGGMRAAELLAASDSVLVAAELEAGQVLLASTTLRDSEISRCAELAVIKAEISNTTIAACSGSPSRLYDVRFIAGALDGAIESDGSTFSRTRFGTRAPTELGLWTGKLSASNLCAGVQALVLGEGTGIQCTTCASETFVADAVCTLPAVDPGLESNLCPGLGPDAELPACQAPFPDRHRPDPNL